MMVFPLSLFFKILLYCVISHGQTAKITLTMPRVQPRQEDSYICTSMKLPSDYSYIVEYKPDAHKETVHHMLLYGCDEPASYKKSWNCGIDGAGTCAEFESILFAWAKDAPPLELPKDVGFKVGGRSKIKYLVLQMHYVHPFKDGQYDSSGLTLNLTSEKQPSLASIYLLYAVQAQILPHTKGVHVDVACRYDSDQEMHAFAFRTHAHDLGRVITGYRVRNGTWKLLGKGDPHAAQAFYPMKNVTTIRRGDILAARCTYDTYNTQRTKVTTIGATSSDEMCNFYLMYYSEGRSHFQAPDGCGDQYSLSYLFTSFPKDSDVALNSSPTVHHHHHGQHSNISRLTVKGSGVEQGNHARHEQEPWRNGHSKPSVEAVKNHTRSMYGNEGASLQVYAPASEQSETTERNREMEVHNQDGRYNASDDVTTGDVTEGKTYLDIPESNEFQETTTTSSHAEIYEDDGRRTSNYVTNVGHSSTGHNPTESVTNGVLPGDFTEEEPHQYVTSTKLHEKTTTINSTKRPPEISGDERSNYVTYDAITDVKTSTANSEQTTGASYTEEPRTVQEGEEEIYPRVKVMVESSTFRTQQTSRTTTQAVESQADTNSTARKEHGLNLGSSPQSFDRKVDKVSFVDNWPSITVAKRLGQVTGVDVDTDGRVVVFHRGGREWDFDTFNEDNTFRNPKTRGPIHESTIFILDAKSGDLLKEWGSNMFYLPHGLTVDHENNVWVTDVGRHQVMKFKRGEFHQPSLTFGENLVPGSDEKHFCKPTDVAVERSGVFYVADGYCNGRVLKFSSEGMVLKEWGEPSLERDPHPGPSTFDIPHSLALDEKHGMLYVADREHGRIQCFDTEGRFHKQISPEMFGPRVFAVDYNDQDDLLYAVNGPGVAKVQGFTIDPSSAKILATWSPQNKGFSQPHAVVSNGSDIYVAEIGPNKVWRIEIRRQEKNFGRDINAAFVNKPSQTSDKGDGDGEQYTGKETEHSKSPAFVILTILSVPAVILLLVGVVSKVRGRKQLHKYDMMDETLGNHRTPRNWCISMNCCSRSYHNMEELYLMDSDSDLEIFPDVHVNKK